MRDTSTENLNQKAKLAPIKQRLSNIELSDLYPKPKTYEDRINDQEEREVRRLNRQPRHLSLSTATRLFAVVAIGTLLYTLTPTLVAWNVISGVFNIVLCMFILFGIIKWQASEVSAAISSSDINDTSFLYLYLCTLGPITAVALYQTNRQEGLLTILLAYVILFLLHFLCIHLLVRYMSRQL